MIAEHEPKNRIMLPSKALRSESGIALLAVIIVIPALLGLTFLGVEVGHIAMIKSELTAAADAAAIAGAKALPDEFNAKRDAGLTSQANYGSATHMHTIAVGRWDEASHSFAANVNPLNAVRVITRRSNDGGNPAQLVIGGFVGQSTSSIEAIAIAARPGGSGGGGARFLIDDEMFDSDVPEIENLAAEYGMTSDEIISDNDGDWFIDMPPGVQIELPTGQVGDEGLFNVNWDAFIYTQSSNPSLEDFLNFNEDGSWRQDVLGSDWDKKLDPLVGVTPVNDAGEYPDFVDPDNCLVSPVYKSDVSNLGSGSVNAKGYRRGLVAFKIIAVGYDPPGSYLPNLIIEICEPITDLASVGISEGGGGGGLGSSVKLVM